MDDMAEIPGGSISKSAIDRRRLLKTAAAAGVGVAVWSTPSITSIGGTPVYAAACTGTVLTYDLGYRNTSCNCESGGTKYAQYKPLGNSCGGTPSPYQVTITSGPGGPAVGNDGDCPPGTSQEGNGAVGNAYASITGTGSLFCKLEVRVTNGQCGAPITVRFTDIIQGPGSLALPGVPCTGQGNIFISAFLVCSQDIGCID